MKGSRVGYIPTCTNGHSDKLYAWTWIVLQIVALASAILNLDVGFWIHNETIFCLCFLALHRVVAAVAILSNVLVLTRFRDISCVNSGQSLQPTILLQFPKHIFHILVMLYIGYGVVISPLGSRGRWPRAYGGMIPCIFSFTLMLQTTPYK
jgi:hypothetical protein